MQKTQRRGHTNPHLAGLGMEPTSLLELYCSKYQSDTTLAILFVSALWCYRIISLVSSTNKTWDLWATLHCYLIQVWVREGRQNIIWFYGFVLFFPSSENSSTGEFLRCGYLPYKKDIKLRVMLDGQ